MAASGWSKRKISAARPRRPEGEGVHVLDVDFGVLEDFQQVAQAAGGVGHLHGHHLGDVDQVTGLLQQRAALCQSETIMRRIPKRSVSASVRVRMLIPVFGQQPARRGHCPGLFSRKSDS